MILHSPTKTLVHVHKSNINVILKQMKKFIILMSQLKIQIQTQTHNRNLTSHNSFYTA